MEEIDLRELIDYFISKIYILFVVLFSVLFIGCLYSFIIKKPIYESSATVILAGKKSDVEVYTQSDLTLNQNLTKTYSEIIKSRKVLNNVIEKENLDYDVDTLSKMINVSNVDNTEIIRISVESLIKEESTNIANAILPIFEKEVTSIYKFDNVSTLDKAVIPNKASNIHYTKEMIIYVLVGFVISFGILFVMYYFDNSIKSRDVIEDKFKLNVIGVIPIVSKEK